MRTSPKASTLLSPSQLKAVRSRSNLWGVYLVTHAWLVVVAMMCLFVAFPNPITFVLAWAVIGSRQLGMLILMHDGAHGLLTESRKLNDFLSQYLCAFPTFADTFIYRRYHLKHHANTLRPEDPDLVLTGHYPITRSSLKRKLWRDITGQTGLSQRIQQIRGACGMDESKLSRRIINLKRNLGRQIMVNVLLFAVLGASGHWYLYPLLWLFPLLTWQQLVLRVRNIAEHAVLPKKDNPFRNARTTNASILERIFLAPYWVNYHLEHHLLMWVPCYRLPLLQRYLQENGYGAEMETETGYRSVLKLVTTGGLPPRVEQPPRQRAVGTFSDGFQT